jgi:hypothetical protein
MNVHFRLCRDERSELVCVDLCVTHSCPSLYSINLTRSHSIMGLCVQWAHGTAPFWNPGATSFQDWCDTCVVSGYLLDDENLFSYPYFHVTHQDPTAKFLKLYVRVVNSIHFMQNGDKNRVKIRSDKSIIFSKI